MRKAKFRAETGTFFVAIRIVDKMENVGNDEASSLREVDLLSELVRKSVIIMLKGHEGQVRKIGGAPYSTHTIMTGNILARYGFGEVVIAAGHDHDLFEETDITEEELKAQVGDKVVEIVKKLLAKTVENGCTQAEAAEAFAKATELLTKHMVVNSR